MAKIIHHETEIVMGKLYKSLDKKFYDKLLYLGCLGQDKDKFLIIVMNDYGGGIGLQVVESLAVDSDNFPNSIWGIGFEEQDG